MEFVIYLIVAVIAAVLIYQGSLLLEKYAEKISKFYQLPPIIHGSIIVAVGSSFPELSSTILSSWLHGEFELGVSAVVGSAMFNILVIPALAGLFSKKTLRADKELVYKDAQFYLIAVSASLITFSFATIYFPEPTINYGGYYTRPLTLIPLGTYVIYLFLQYLEAKEYKSQKKAEKGNPWKLWAMLSWSLLLVVIGVEGLVRFCLYLGDLFQTPSFIWGISIMAIVTSIPDAMISIRLARANKNIVSLSNVLGSNIFDLLVGVPAGVLIVGKALINFEVATPLMASLTGASLLFFVFMRHKLSLTAKKCWMLLLFYVIFIVCAFILQ